MKIKYVFFVLFFFVQNSCTHKNKNQKQSKPNLLFIFADQYRRASLGFLNEDPVITPHLDRLAKEGIFFSEAVSNHPLCSPFRGMLMKGHHLYILISI